MARIVRYVLAKTKPGVSREDYERFEREVDYVVSSQIASIVSYRTHRITEVGERLAPTGWDYIERIEITDRAAYRSSSSGLPFSASSRSYAARSVISMRSM